MAELSAVFTLHLRGEVNEAALRCIQLGPLRTVQEKEKAGSRGDQKQTREQRQQDNASSQTSHTDSRSQRSHISRVI
ncbi:MAG: hypothetical protein INR71_05630 [Terriglobus roseus]|nr:hypothetical protein [Terriglobus roseus]